MNNEICEMRLCEASFLVLKPDVCYRFTVDPNCQACVEAEALANGENTQEKSNSLSSLIDYIGDDNIKLQFVSNCLDGTIELVEDGVTRFSMLTESENLSPDDLITGEFRKTGILLWLDPEEVEVWRLR